ncbi:MAG: hypothetical protein AB1656_13555 [Candidatus Omnitrophota bacterium]
MKQNLDAYLEEESGAIYKTCIDSYRVPLRSGWNDLYDLCRYAGLREKVEKQVISHFHDKLVRKIQRGETDRMQFDQELFDLLVLRRAFGLIRRFYRAQGLEFLLIKR